MAGFQKHTSWFPIGIIGIALGVILFFSGLFAYNYIEWLSTWHSTDGTSVRDWQYPYRGVALPLSVLGLCMAVVGIVGFFYDRHILKMSGQNG